MLAVSACGKTESTSTKPNSSSTEACRIIQHAMGETCVPRNPQRIVVLDYVMLDNTITLDKKPVGSPLKYAHPDFKTDIVDLGDSSAINLERILALQPDLILGITNPASPYSQLAQIAPTVLMNFDHSGDWKKHIAFIGDALGKSDEVKQIMADYYQRTKEFKQKMGAKTSNLVSEGSDEIQEVSVVRIDSTEISLYTKTGLIGTVLEDVGLSRPPSQDLDFESTKALGSNSIHYSISREVLDKADGDAIFFVVDYWDSQIEDSLSSLKTDPLWLTLDAVKQNKVYEIPASDWVSSGLITANAVLDDLFKYLVEQ
ncbi:MAG: iron-siderophore ABC transporter substrate-binding protein [Cyanobacteria bacterium P01_G01_bin.67]